MSKMCRTPPKLVTNGNKRSVRKFKRIHARLTGQDSLENLGKLTDQKAVNVTAFTNHSEESAVTISDTAELKHLHGL